MTVTFGAPPAVATPTPRDPRSDHKSLIRPSKGKIAQLIDLQWVLWEAAMSPDTESRDKAVLACAWERLENRLGRLRMKPEPKPASVEEIEAAKSRRRTKVTSDGPSEPIPMPKSA